MQSLAPTTCLIAACCRTNNDPGKPSAIRRYMAALSDPQTFLDAVTRHRVNTQTFEALRDDGTAPSHVVEALASRSKALRMRGIKQLSELVRITAILKNADIRVAEIKGMTLGMLAYGKTGLKESKDIDLLVSPKQGKAAVQLLLANGYRHDKFGVALRGDQINALVCNRKDIALTGPGNTKLDLHWRLTHGSGLLRGVGERLEWQQVEVTSGHKVSTLAMPDLIAYLAVHGSLHNWSRLKWLADFDALFRSAAPAQKNEWIAYAEGLGAARCLRYAIAMSTYVIGPYPEEADSGKSTGFVYSHGMQKILSYGLHCLEVAYPPPRITLLQKLAILINDINAQFKLFRRPADACSLLSNTFIVEKDILLFPLPARLKYLYPAVRTALWVLDRLRLRKLRADVDEVTSIHPEGAGPVGPGRD